MGWSRFASPEEILTQDIVTGQDIVTKIAVLGGTGKEGSGLALRWAAAGYDVTIGSRDAEKAQRAAADLNATLGKDIVRGMANRDAAAQAHIVVLTVPYAAHVATLELVKDVVQDKIFVDVTVPLDTQNVRRVKMPPTGSAAIEAQQVLGQGVKVVSAFHNISAEHLKSLDHEIECDALVCGNDKDAKRQVIEMARAARIQAWDAGPIENSMVAEGLTSVLINLNIRHKVKAAGIRIAGIPR
jgi:NADPH-dependent F420 reductase